MIAAASWLLLAVGIYLVLDSWFWWRRLQRLYERTERLEELISGEEDPQ